MINIIKEMYNKNNNVMIYKIGSDNSFIYGQILGFDEEFVAIKMFSPKGENDGVQILKVVNILKIEVGGKYEQKMRIMCATNNKGIMEYVIDNNEMVKSILQLALKKQGMVSIELLDSSYYDIVGIPVNICDNRLEILLIDEYGDEDGTVYCCVEDITQINYMSEDEQILRKLWKSKKA